MLSRASADEDGRINIVTFSQQAEDHLRDSALPVTEGYPMQWPPDILSSVIEALRSNFPADSDQQPVLLTSSQMRAGLSSQLRAFGFSIRVLAPTDISPSFPVSPVATVNLPSADAQDGNESPPQ